MKNNRFEIQSHVHKLTPKENGEKNYYHCPVCGDDNFYVDPRSHKWGCFSTGCDHQSIIEALSPKSEWLKEKGFYTETQKQKFQEEKIMTKSKTNTQVNYSIAPSIARVVTLTDYNKPNIVEGFDEEIITTYFYSEEKRVIRKDIPEKGKEIRPQYRDANKKWVTGKGEGLWGLYQLNHLTHNIVGNWLIIVEGEKCAEYFLSEGILATTPQSNEYTEKSLREPLKTLQANGLKGIVILPDHDKPGYAKAEKLEKIADSLEIPNVTIPYTVFHKDLKEGGDIVDLLLSLEGVVSIVNQLGDLDMSGFIERLEKEIQSALKKKYLEAELVTTQPEISKKPSQAVERLTQEIAANLLIKRFNGNLIYHSEQAIWRQWNGKYWRVVSDNFVDNQIIQVLESEGLVYNTNSFIEGTRKLLGKKQANFNWEIANRTEYVNFNNGTLNLTTSKLRSHNPSDYFTSCLPYDYNPLTTISADILTSLKNHCPITYSFFSQAMGDNEEKIIKLLAVINGVVKYQFSKFQKFTYIVGKPASGKGTFLRLLQEIVGTENYQATRIAKLNDDYHVATVIDKQLVLCSDEDKQKGNYANLKSMTGGDSVSYRQIYGRPASSHFYGSIVVVANEDIFSGSTVGIERRLCHLRFENSIPSENRDELLDEKLKTEIPNFLPIVLGLDDQIVKAYIKGTGKGKIADFESSSWDNKISSDSVAEWLDNQVIFDSSAKAQIGTKDGNNEHLYCNYVRYCEGLKLQACSGKEFGKRIELHCEFLNIPVEKKRYKEGNFYLGMRVRSEGDNQKTILEMLGLKELTQHYPTFPTSSLLGKDLNPTPNPTPTQHFPKTNSIPTPINSEEKPNDAASSLKDVGNDVGLKPLPSKDDVGSVGKNQKNNARKNSTFTEPPNFKIDDEVCFLSIDLDNPICGIVSDDSNAYVLEILDENGMIHKDILREKCFFWEKED